MGATYDSAGSDYTVGLSLLTIVALGALVFTLFGLGKPSALRAGR